MTLGALVDLGLPLTELQELLDLLGLKDLELSARRVEKDHLALVDM